MKKKKYKVKTKNMMVFCFVIGLISLMIFLIMYLVYNSVVNEDEKNNKKEVEIKNIEVSVLGDASYDKSKDSDGFFNGYVVKLKSPGDSVCFTFDIANNSNSSYVIKEFEKSDVQCNGTGSNAIDDALLVCSHISYSLTYANGEIISEGDSIASNTYKEAILKITFEDNDVVPQKTVEVTGFDFKLSVK